MRHRRVARWPAGTSFQALCIGDPLDKGLDEYNFAATGTSKEDQSSFSVKVTAADGQIIGGLTGYVETGRTLSIPGGNDQPVDVPGLGHLGTLTLLDRRTITYHDTEGYNLALSGIPARWGNLTIKQYRVDAASDMTLVSSNTVVNSGAAINVSGAWAHSPAAPPADPVGVAQGVDVIVVQGDGRPF